MAAQLSVRHGLRLEPAIQLAAALRMEAQLEWNAKTLTPPLVRLVTLDRTMGLAARAEGLAVAPE